MKKVKKKHILYASFKLSAWNPVCILQLEHISIWNGYISSGQ